MKKSSSGRRCAHGDRIYRNASKNLNSIDSSTSSNTTTAFNEEEKGCSHFFLPNSISSSNSSSSSSSPKTPLYKSKKTLYKTPESAPNARFMSKPSKCKKKSRMPPSSANPEKPLLKKMRISKKNPPGFYQLQSGKRPIFVDGQNSPPSSAMGTSCASVNKLECRAEDSKEEKQQPQQKECLTKELEITGNYEIPTPVSKISRGSFSNYTFEDKFIDENTNSEPESNKTSNKTPPIEASVSPEIQGGSSLVSTTRAACYGAGHLVSGVSDKRKCRPRGVLTVGENGISESCGPNFTDENVVKFVNNPKDSVVPLPTEASVQWLLSPFDENDEQNNGVCGNGLPFTEATKLDFHSPPSSDLEFSLNLFNTSNNTTIGKTDKGRTNFLSGEESSPFSIDSLSCGNVMQTPESDSSSHRHHIGAETDHEESRFQSELDSVAKDLQMIDLSHKSQTSLCTDTSFQFDCKSMPSDSINFTQLRIAWDNQSSWTSYSTLASESESQMRISWRDSSMSHIFETDELDCCRCLSDEEEDEHERVDKGNNNEKILKELKNAGNDQSLTTNVESLDFSEHELGPDIKDKDKDKMVLKRLGPCAESISIDEGSLIASHDSDWNLCYK